MSMLREPSAGEPTFLGVSFAHIQPLLVVPFAVTGISMILAPSLPWSALLAVWFSALVWCHAAQNTANRINVAGIVSVSATVQWLIGPVLASLYPAGFATFHFDLPLAQYLAYALPATFAYWVGVNLPGLRPQRAPMPGEATPLPRHWRIRVDILIAVGIIAAHMLSFSTMGTFFIVTLVSFAEVTGSLAYMLTQTPGWKLRVGIVALDILTRASTNGLFFPVVLLGGYYIAAYGYSRRWRWRFAIVLFLALAGSVALQYVKYDYRLYVASQLQDTGEMPSAFDRVSTLGKDLWDFATEGHGNARFGDVLVRFDQGWIIARIMRHVPEHEPFAHGSTLIDAVKFTVLPRILFPNKPVDNSRILFGKFTGSKLGPETSMGLSIPGEMYANFGILGGCLGTLGFALLVGCTCRVFENLGRRSVLWWAIAPVVFFAALDPSNNVAVSLNFGVKAVLALAAVIVFSTSARTLLGLRRPLQTHSIAVPRAVGPASRAVSVTPSGVRAE